LPWRFTLSEIFVYPFLPPDRLGAQIPPSAMTFSPGSTCPVTRTVFFLTFPFFSFTPELFVSSFFFFCLNLQRQLAFSFVTILFAIDFFKPLTPKFVTILLPPPYKDLFRFRRHIAERAADVVDSFSSGASFPFSPSSFFPSFFSCSSPFLGNEFP